MNEKLLNHIGDFKKKKGRDSSMFIKKDYWFYYCCDWERFSHDNCSALDIFGWII